MPEFRLALTDQFGQHRPTPTMFRGPVPVSIARGIKPTAHARPRLPETPFVKTPSTPPDTVPIQSPTAKRQQILDGAMALFLANGYEGTSMSQIAREAGVSKGTLYNYFDCKAALFSAMVEVLAQTRLRNVFEPVHSDDLDCATTLARLGEAMIRMMLEPSASGLYRIIVAEAGKFPLLAAVFWQHGFGVSVATMAEWISGRTARGEIAAPDPVFAAEQFFMLCQTRIVQRSRFVLPVDTSDAAIAAVARSASDAFMKLYVAP